MFFALFTIYYNLTIYRILQYAKGNLLPANIPKVNLEDNAEVTEKTISTSLRRALNQYCTLQAHDGHWPGDNNGIMFIMPMFVSIPFKRCNCVHDYTLFY